MPRVAAGNSRLSARAKKENARLLHKSESQLKARGSFYRRRGHSCGLWRLRPQKKDHLSLHNFASDLQIANRDAALCNSKIFAANGNAKFAQLMKMSREIYRLKADVNMRSLSEFVINLSRDVPPRRRTSSQRCGAVENMIEHRSAGQHARGGTR